MIRDICKDEFFLSQKAEPAMAGDLEIAQDLLDTLTAHKDGCVGMAANMIGVNRPSRCSGRTSNSRRASKHSPAGRRRSFSMKLTIVRGF